MQDYVWRHRIVLVLVLLLAVQAPFIVLRLASADGGTPHPIAEVGHVVVTSGLAAYLFSKRFESWLEHRLYGGLRKQWKEVRVMYSDGLGKGMGEAYPGSRPFCYRPRSFTLKRLSGSASPACP